MDKEKLIKLIKDNCYKETNESDRSDEVRYFMTDTDVVELVDDLVEELNIHDVSKCPDCKSESFIIDKLYNKCKECFY